MSRSRYEIFETAYPSFLTCSVVEWLPVFTRPETVQIVFDS
jgi:putative transposase